MAPPFRNGGVGSLLLTLPPQRDATIRRLFHWERAGLRYSPILSNDEHFEVGERVKIGQLRYMVGCEVERVEQFHLRHVIYVDDMIVAVADHLQTAFVENHRALV